MISQTHQRMQIHLFMEAYHGNVPSSFIDRKREAMTFISAHVFSFLKALSHIASFRFRMLVWSMTRTTRNCVQTGMQTKRKAQFMRPCRDRFEGSGFRVQGVEFGHSKWLGFRVQDLGCRIRAFQMVEVSWLGHWGFRFEVWI